ncbi:Protein of unknown function [Bacillus cytotoxicus]|nr:Protein of unknown function [Bacillus cytotoxicus]
MFSSEYRRQPPSVQTSFQGWQSDCETFQNVHFAQSISKRIGYKPSLASLITKKSL